MDGDFQSVSQITLCSQQAACSSWAFAELMETHCPLPPPGEAERISWLTVWGLLPTTAQPWHGHLHLLPSGWAQVYPCSWGLIEDSFRSAS